MKRWLDGLHYDDVIALKERGGLDACPEWSWPTDEDMESGAHRWQLRLRAIPLDAHQRNTGGPLLWNGISGADWADFQGPLSTALEKKATRYGQLDLPLVVAVNIQPGFPRRGDEVRALFGKHVRHHPGSQEAFLPDRPGGVWHNGTSPQRRTLSAAWVFMNIEPLTLLRAKSTLYTNPWAHRPIPADLTSFDHASVAGERVTWHDGERFGEVFEGGGPRD